MDFLKKYENILISIAALAFIVTVGIRYDLGGVANAWFFQDSYRDVSKITFLDKDQNELNLGTNFKGKPLVVQLWATWCGVCVKKMGDMDSLAVKMRAKGGDVLAISNDRGGLGVIKAFYIKQGLTNLVPYIDSKGQFMKAVEALGLPTTILVDGNGQIAGIVEGGFNWDSREGHEIIKDKLGIDLNS